MASRRDTNMTLPRRPIERNLALELVRVTEAAALAAARYLGRGDKTSVDKAAVDAMRYTLGHIRMDGVVVIGEGEKDRAPMLYIGERIGDGSGPAVDIAVDPVDGTTLVARGLPGAVSTVALSTRGSMHFPRDFHYVNKIAVGAEAKDVIDIRAPVTENLKAIARAKKKALSEITVVVLDRPRNEQLLADIRSGGARVKLISDGDLAASIEAAMPGREVDALMGIGGTPEAILSAAAIHCVGGEIQCVAWPRDRDEQDAALAKGIDVDKVYATRDMIDSDDVFFAATGISSGELLKGVRYYSGGAQTQSLAMRCRSGTVRWIDAYHNLARLDKLFFFTSRQ